MGGSGPLLFHSEIKLLSNLDRCFFVGVENIIGVFLDLLLFTLWLHSSGKNSHKLFSFVVSFNHFLEFIDEVDREARWARMPQVLGRLLVDCFRQRGAGLCKIELIIGIKIEQTFTFRLFLPHIGKHCSVQFIT